MGEFPFHTDFVLAEHPPQFLIFFVAKPREFGTTIFDCWTLPPELRTQSIFLVDQPHHRRYVRFEANVEEQVIVRYNDAFFRPQNDAANTLLSLIEVARNTQVIDWKLNSMAIIDNWRLLHGREANSKMQYGSIRRIAAWGRR